ncbi:Aste57867_18637 [Aphanomyces stellatus]|uniref:Aste57867_18637 protein n=1 Tax=Aphanomyces stellatus TaxID=120398 RepID=A0A485LCB6_9STRA|nr:hypothetical protein As57867_018575 [Aphanomyces stellatus]VFT95372.1 Aste57867_18637 [Aphanomyces stellatus]
MSKRAATPAGDKGKKKRAKVDIASAFKFKSYLNLFSGLSATDSDTLVQDCKACFTCREVEEGDNYSLGSTFFLRADETPACGMEVLAKKIFDLHATASGVEFDPATSGAEWWTQHIDQRDNIGFHWDRDYGMEEDDEEHVHPYLGTVTYLCVHAGPTVVLDTRGTFEYGADISGPLRHAIVSRPKAGKHITFDGELLHGAPSELAYPLIDDDVDGVIRVTFLVNIWINHLPVQSQRLDADVAATLQLPMAHAAALALNSADMEDTHVETYKATAVVKTHRFAIQSSGDDYIIQLTLPVALKGVDAGSTVDCIALDDSAIVAGELTESSDDEEEGDEDDGDDE